jgi:putative endonuclease
MSSSDLILLVRVASEPRQIPLGYEMAEEKISQDGLLKRLKRFVLNNSSRSRLFGQARSSGLNSGRAGVVDKDVPLTRREVGSRGEKLAVDFLKGLGYKIVQMNFRCRQGEIDIIAQQGECLVFVEVRTKKSCDFGTPEESVTSSKREKLISLANIYLQTLDGLPPSWRIDVVAVELTPDDRLSRLEHIENAIS